MVLKWKIRCGSKILGFWLLASVWHSEGVRIFHGGHHLRQQRWIFIIKYSKVTAYLTDGVVKLEDTTVWIQHQVCLSQAPRGAQVSVIRGHRSTARRQREQQQRRQQQQQQQHRLDLRDSLFEIQLRIIIDDGIEN